MDNDGINLTSLIEKYEQMRALGKKIYFDADEFVILAEYYSGEGDSEEAEHLVEEGLAMHPGSSELMSYKAKTLIYSAKYEEALEFIKYFYDESDIDQRSEEHTSELQSHHDLVCRLLLEKNFFNDTATTEIYTLSLHDALPIS